MSIPEEDLHVDIAASRAPVKPWAVVTPELLALLRFRPMVCRDGMLFDVDGIYAKIESYLTVWMFGKRGTLVWWVGDATSRALVSVDDWDRLSRAEAIDGDVLVDGQRYRLMYRGVRDARVAKLESVDADTVDNS